MRCNCPFLFQGTIHSFACFLRNLATAANQSARDNGYQTTLNAR